MRRGRHDGGRMKLSGLVLNAGGARGAYQAGVLRRIGEIRAFQKGPSPFPIIAGASAGAINGAAIAAGSGNFHEATENLAILWSQLKTSDIYRTDVGSLSSLIGRFVKDMTLGKLIGGGKAQSLLDASPLSDLLKTHLKTENIQTHIDHGHLYAVAISAINYYSGKSFTFIQGKKGHPVWEKSRRIALSCNIQVEHICASSAIPLLFQPVKVATPLGDFYFGDGGLRLTNPLSPAIRLGAERLLAIGIRSQKAAEDRWQKDLMSFQSNRAVMRKPPIAQIIGVALNSIFLDYLDTDADHLKRINDIVANLPKSTELKEPIRPVDLLVINPSTDLGAIADLHASKMPTLLRYFLEGFGSRHSDSADLVSYLLFDSDYTRDLIELGYQDAQQRIDEIESFLRAAPLKLKSNFA